MKHWVFRLSVGLVFAAVLMLASVAIARGDSATPTPDSRECQSCHASIDQAWTNGSHGKAISDITFQKDWQDKGSPKECLACHTTGYDAATGTYQAEGITCAACHDPVPGNHPLSPASMTRASQMCGNCHKDTYFEWKSSKHGQSDLTCVSCHDPHATSLKASNASDLCSTCHGTRVSTFAHTSHSEKGLTCADCHIGAKNTELGDGHGSRNHTFAVNLSTCNQCHSYDMHNPAGAMIVPADTTATPAPAPDSMNSGHPTTVSAEPTPVGPLGYAIITGLVGLASGIVLAPWLETGFRRFTGGTKGPKSKHPVEVKP